MLNDIFNTDDWKKRTKYILSVRYNQTMLRSQLPFQVKSHLPSCSSPQLAQIHAYNSVWVMGRWLKIKIEGLLSLARKRYVAKCVSEIMWIQEDRAPSGKKETIMLFEHCNEGMKDGRLSRNSIWCSTDLSSVVYLPPKKKIRLQGGRHQQ